MPKLGQLKEHHVIACQLRVEENFNNAQIAKKLGVSPVAVHNWWKTPYVMRYLAKLQKEYALATAPKMISKFEDILESAVTRIRDMLDEDMVLKPKLRPRDLVEIVKLSREVLSAEYAKLPQSEETDKEAKYDEIWELLTEEEREVLVRRLLENRKRKLSRQSLVQGDPVLGEGGPENRGNGEASGSGEL